MCLIIAMFALLVINKAKQEANSIEKLVILFIQANSVAMWPTFCEG